MKHLNSQEKQGEHLESIQINLVKGLITIRNESG
jgi:hypothetical protein